MTQASAMAATLWRRTSALLAHWSLAAMAPVAWAGSLWRSRVLLSGQQHRYMGFRPKNALNSLFYRTQWLNIARYGRNGTSPVAGLGEYPLSRWFHISRISHAIYANAGAATMLGGTLAWALAHLAWLYNTTGWWVLLTTAVVLLSTTTYAMAFVRQNYNILGWLWMPLALFAANAEIWVLAALCWFAASLTSITVIFVAVPLMAAQAVLMAELSPVFALLPALVTIALRGRFLLRNGNLTESFLSLGRLIGLIPTKIRYHRASKRFNRNNAFFSALYFSACALIWAVDAGVPWLPLLAATIFVVNQRFFRFADDQSVVILFLSVFAAHTLTLTPSVPALGILLLVANPPPFLFGLVDVDVDPEGVRKRIAIYSPFDHTAIERGCTALFADAPAGSRILFAFDDPQGTYERLFDGYRNAIEPLFHVAAEHHLHLFPDWHAVAETNSDEDFHIWGRSLEAVDENRRHWEAGFVLYYLPADSDLPQEWSAAYEIAGCFDYSNHLEELAQALPWSGDKACPKFLLLKPVAGSEQP